MRGKAILYLAALCLLLLVFGAWHTGRQARSVERELDALREELAAQQLQLETSRQLLKEVRRLREENEELHQRMTEWLDTWEVDTWEATAYAPLDPRAQDGMCYSGDPRVTASGAEVIPYYTAAAGPDISFGTRVYVIGEGLRVVHDRGGRVGPGQIDLAVETREEAFGYGRREVTVAYEQQGD